MADKKLKPFVRGSGIHRDENNWGGYKVDKVKAETPLDDIAARSNVTALREGDLFCNLNDYSDEEGTEYHDDQWFEVLEVQKMDEDYRETSYIKDICRIFVYVYPVDEFGNALTKAQILKAAKAKGDWAVSKANSWISSIDKNGYALMLEYRGYDDSPLTDYKTLTVKTEALEDSDRDWKVIGRKISKATSTNDFKYYDEDGYLVPEDDALEQWQNEHPGETFDPEFDSVKRYKTDTLDSYGTKEDRIAYSKRASQEKADSEAAFKKRYPYEDVSMYSCFGGYRSEFEKIQKEAGMSDEDIKQLEAYAKEIGYAYGSHEPTMSAKELKAWTIEHHGDWKAVARAISNQSREFTEARHNAYIANN